MLFPYDISRVGDQFSQRVTKRAARFAHSYIHTHTRPSSASVVKYTFLAARKRAAAAVIIPGAQSPVWISCEIREIRGDPIRGTRVYAR